MTQIVKEMRMRKRTTANPTQINNLVISALSRDGIVIALLLRVNNSDHTGEFDPFYQQRIKTAMEFTFFDEQGELLKSEIRKLECFKKMKEGQYYGI